MSGTTKPRVVITGLGVVSPIGCDLDTVWQSLSEGRSGIRPITSLPMQSLPFQSGGECVDFTGAIEDYGVLDKQLQRAIKKNSKVMCREIEMGVAAAQKLFFTAACRPIRETLIVAVCCSVRTTFSPVQKNMLTELRTAAMNSEKFT